MRIIFSGGGTMGPVTPLLAIKEALDATGQHDYLWLGTKRGPERSVVTQVQMTFKTIPSGKWRRYFDWRNFVDPFIIFLGFLKSLWLVWRFKPDVILTAGGFVCVPVAYAGWVLRKKVLVHQQDLRIGLANRLMKPIATKITVAFPELTEKFSAAKVEVTGNPVRKILFDGDRARGLLNFGLSPDLPVIMVAGGGVGSEIINKTFIENSQALTQFCQVIHSVGKGVQSKWLDYPIIQNNPRYRAFEFLTDDLADAYAAADLVICRGGIATLTELAALGKPAIVIPIPKNQQVDNAEFFKKHEAIIYVRQADFDGSYIISLIQGVLDKPSWRQSLSQNIKEIMPQQAAQEYVRLIENLVLK